MTLGTVVVLAALVSAVALALKSIIKGKAKGCGCSSCSCSSGCSCCPAAQKMAEDMEAEALAGLDPSGNCPEKR
ncbi:MAG: hypothetical protein ACI4B9_06805 [Eggerthellaceae bacterium]